MKEPCLDRIGQQLSKAIDLMQKITEKLELAAKIRQLYSRK